MGIGVLFGLLMGMGMGIVLMGMGIAYEVAVQWRREAGASRGTCPD